ncbi:MAG: arginine N-succinyltransferase [Phycisphaerales bacterium]|nr:arginine N-succinyltransferase [Phycisphaerales bacterium]
MFVIRHAEPRDLDDLHALAKQTYLINLPPDREIIAHKVDQSLRSFAGLAARAETWSVGVAGRVKGAGGLGGVGGAGSVGAGRHAKHQHGQGHASGLRAVTGKSDLFLLVLENIETRSVIGTSQVISSMGGPGHPRYYMTLSRVAKSSRSLGMGWEHLVGRMGQDETGPSEIGGIILNHAFRGHPLRLGRLLSFARFHMIGLFRKRFADRLIAEMLGPITRNGYNPFYEKFTRHFITRAFADVYRFSQMSREFVETLLPEGDIFLSILDPEVANAAGEVGDDTRPARKILERMGFEYFNRIDPMDGGPHLEAVTSDLHLVKSTRRISGVISAAKRGAKAQRILVSSLDDRGHFRLVESTGSVGADGKATIAREFVSQLAIDDAEVLGATVLDADKPARR